MNKIISLAICAFSLVSGYLLIPSLYFGFVVATNSTKGWNVKNDDGLLFIPLGVILLIVSLLVVIGHIICLIKSKKREKYLFFGLHLFGIIVYLIHWYFY